MSTLRRDRGRIALGILPLMAALGCFRSSEPVDPGPPDGLPVEADRLLSPGSSTERRVLHGWFVHEGRVIWGYAQHNGWWGGYREGDGWWVDAGVRANLTRRAPGRFGPGLTEDIERLTDSMLLYGYPGFEHNSGLWYDRRRDAHDVDRRSDDAVVAPFLEQPWARSGQGRAWDGLSLYDLEQYNSWYFARLREFAASCDRKGTILLFNFYMQHALLEQQAHYADFPWRPANSVQDTGMPDRFPAANTFYEVSHPMRRRLHRAYIRKCLDELGGFRNVVFLLGMEFTGPLEFARFWIDTIHEWEEDRGRAVLSGVGATKDVLDALLEDPVRGPRIAVIDLRYWFFLPDGTLHAPRGGREVPGRYAGGGKSGEGTPEQIYRQVAAYRGRFPERPVLHAISADRQQTWAFLMAGGSMLVRPLGYLAPPLPVKYTAPDSYSIVRPLYDLVRERLASDLPRMHPLNQRVVSSDGAVWALGDDGTNLLVYALRGGCLEVHLGEDGALWRSRWFDPRTGRLHDPVELRAEAPIELETPTDEDWALWLRRTSASPPGS